MKDNGLLLPYLKGKASVQGTYAGQKMEGNTLVELFNLFPAFANLDKAKRRAMPVRKAPSI